jgi:hypothetical protein
VNAHPADVVFLFDCMTADPDGKPSSVHQGFVRIRAQDGEIEWFGFDGANAAQWDQVERLNPAVIKLCRNTIGMARRLRHAARDLQAEREALGRTLDVVQGRKLPYD